MDLRGVLGRFLNFRLRVAAQAMCIVAETSLGSASHIASTGTSRFLLFFARNIGNAVEDGVFDFLQGFLYAFISAISFLFLRRSTPRVELKLLEQLFIDLLHLFCLKLCLLKLLLEGAQILL